MKKKILICVSIVVLIVSLIVISISLKPKESNTNENQIVEEKTIEEQTVEVLALDDTDKNVIGYISIEKIGLEKAPVADGTDLTTIGKYVGHFENTSYLDGNVCLCSHNRGSKAAYFGEIKNLCEGDIITYITKYETKQYEVKEVKQIKETDLSVLNQTEENQITLITCVENQRNLRQCVVGKEKTEVQYEV